MIRQGKTSHTLAKLDRMNEAGRDNAGRLSCRP
jgi:hypothetical protein